MVPPLSYELIIPPTVILEYINRELLQPNKGERNLFWSTV